MGTNSPPTTHALDASSGNELWSNVPGGGTAIADGVLYRSSAETLQALDARTGSILWEVSIEEGELIGPVVSGDVVYVHSTVGKLYAFDARNRKAQDRSPLWVGKTAIQTNGDGPRLPAVGNGKVFVGANSTFYAFETAAGEESERNPVWTAKVEAPFFASAPSVANGVVYSAAGNHDIYAFDAATGKVLWNYRTRGREFPMRSSPTIVNGRLFHADTFGFTLYAFDIPETTGRTPPPAKDRDTPILKKSNGAVTSDEQPKTVNESKDAAVATIKALGGKVTFGQRNPGKPVVGVSLFNTKVTDTGLEHLKGMTSLHILDLRSTKVTDAGLVHLNGLKNLQNLVLANTQVTNTGLEHLKGMTSLTSLDLTDTEVTDAGLEHLKELTNMQVLGLNRTKVTDAGLMNLKGMTSLQVLVLASTEVTDAGLIHLKRLTNLKKLYLDRTKVTDAGVKDLQTALPKCRISK